MKLQPEQNANQRRIDQSINHSNSGVSDVSQLERQYQMNRFYTE